MWTKLKRWGWAVLLGIVVVLGFLLGFRYERSKIRALKISAKLAGLQEKRKHVEAAINEHIDAAEISSNTDEQLSEEIKTIDRQIAEVKDAVATREEEDLVARFNEMYRR